MKRIGTSLMCATLLALAAATLATPAVAETNGWGAGLNIYDGEFGVQARKDLWMGGDISQLTFQGSVIFAGKTIYALDLDYHFIIQSEGSSSRFYPLAGLNFMFHSDNSEFGLNLGGGANFMLTDKLAAYAELKYIISDWDAFGIGVGIYF
jgi:opacity protein-like surface antigen